MNKTQQQFKRLNTKPPGARPGPAMAIEATVENNPQPLRKLRSYFASQLLIPNHLKLEAQIVLRALFDCFDKHKVVNEGLIGDLVWGFEQVTPPITRQCTVIGLIDLERGGFIKFQAPDNSYVTFESDLITKAWVRYQPKLLDMVYERVTA